MYVLSAFTAFVLISSNQAIDPKALTIDQCVGKTAKLEIDSDAPVEIYLPSGDTDRDPVNSFVCEWDVTLSDTLPQNDSFFTLNVGSANFPNGTTFTVGCAQGSFKQTCGPAAARWNSHLCPTKMIVPCNNVTLSFSFYKNDNTRRYQMNHGVKMVDQTILPTNANECPTSPVLDHNGNIKSISFFNSFYTESHKCEMSVRVDGDYIIEYISAKTVVSHMLLPNYTLFDSNSENIQRDCTLKLTTPGACLPRSTTGSTGAIWARPPLFNENSDSPIPLSPSIVFDVKAVASAQVQHGTQNCYCGDENLSLSSVQSPNYGGTGACANMHCTYMVMTSDYSKILQFTKLSDTILGLDSPTSSVTAVSVGHMNDVTASLFECEYSSCSVRRQKSYSNRVRLIYRTGTVNSATQSNLEGGSWKFDVSVVDTPGCGQLTYDVSNFAYTQISPLGQYLNQKCSVTLTAASSNSNDDDSDCGYTSIYQPTLSYSDFSFNCVSGLTISIYDGSDSSGNLLGTVDGCSGNDVSATSTTKKLYLVWQRKNADISEQGKVSVGYDYESGSYKSCYNYGWIWYAVLIPVLCAIVFITIMYTIRYRRMRLMRRGVVHAQAPTAVYTVPTQNQQMYATPQAYPQQQMQYQPQMMSPTPPTYADLTNNPANTTTNT